MPNRGPLVGLAVLLLVTLVAVVVGVVSTGPPSFEAQACGLPAEWLERIRRGHFESRSGEISLVPRRPAYMASGAGGWSHAGPWPYLQDVPLVFYGPGLIPSLGDVDRPVTLVDVVPTFGTFLRSVIHTDGTPLEEVARLDAASLAEEPPRLIVSVVWDGGGWNVLEHWPGTWPNLERVMEEGVSYTNATVGSSPSVTSSVHTTLGTGFFPATHGVSAIRLRDEGGRVVDSFLKGESSRFILVPTLAERWDEQNDNRSLVGMVGYEPWHLGMIGMGSERPTGDKDHAVWLDPPTNEWITNPNYYELPDSIVSTEGLDEDLEELDAADGRIDRAWEELEILDDPARIEETPAFIAYHTRAMMNLIEEEGYGGDEVTDFVYTNYKQIDRVGHYYNMASDKVRDSIVASDQQLGVLIDFLEEEVGHGRYVLVVTADHGQQPDFDANDGFGINPQEVGRDIDNHFGPVTDFVSSTDVFLAPGELEERGTTVDDVAKFLAGYRVQENSTGEQSITGTSLGPAGKLFELALPNRLLDSIDCVSARSG